MANFKVMAVNPDGSIYESKNVELPYETAEQAMRSDKMQRMKRELLESGLGIQVRRVNNDGERV